MGTAATSAWAMWPASTESDTLNTHILPCALFLLVVGSAGCRKSGDVGPVEWPGTTLPCDADEDCVKVPTFSGGCGQTYGYLEAIHRREVETYKTMYREYKIRSSPSIHMTSLSNDTTCGWNVMARCRNRHCKLIDEKGDIPKEKLKHLNLSQYAPPEYRQYTSERLRTCVRNDDCVKVRAEQCKARFEAVHRQHERIFRELRYKDVQPIDCPRIASDPTAAAEVVPVCHQGQCQLTGGDLH
jgi:hypothetical protein